MNEKDYLIEEFNEMMTKLKSDEEKYNMLLLKIYLMVEGY